MQKYKTIEECLNDLSEGKRAIVELLREFIVTIEPRLVEHIKWNAPSYVFNDEDRITFNLMNKQGLVKLVFHMGATRKEDKKGKPIMQDEFGIIEWNSDIRGTVTFTDIEDAHLKEKQLKTVVKKWLSVSS